MSRAIPQPEREEIVRRRQEGQSLSDIAEEMGLKYRTVQNLWGRFQKCGTAKLGPDYEGGGPQGPRFDQSLYHAAVTLKEEHRGWGAGLIRLQLAPQFPGQVLPAVRTLQSWFQQAQLQPLRGAKLSAPCRRAQVCHAVWQMDGKEQIRLGDGSESVVFSVVDEASGAALSAALFPPEQMHSGSPWGSAKRAAGSVCALGAAPSDARGQRMAVGQQWGLAPGVGAVVDRAGSEYALE